MANNGAQDAGTRTAWISYLNDGDEKTDAFVEILEQTPAYLKFRTSKNIITISYSRLLKLKEKNVEAEK